MPMRLNAKPLRRNTTTCQVEVALKRVAGEKILDAEQDTNMPADTTASTPETPSISAGTYAANGVRSVTADSSVGSSMRRCSRTVSQPTASPIAIPTSGDRMKLTAAVVGENCPVSAAATA